MSKTQFIHFVCGVILQRNNNIRDVAVVVGDVVQVAALVRSDVAQVLVGAMAMVVLAGEVIIMMVLIGEVTAVLLAEEGNST